MLLRSLSAALAAALVPAALVLPVAAAAPPSKVPVVTCYAAAPPGGTPEPSFQDRTAALPVAALRGRSGHAMGWGDANGDGWPDLFLGTYGAYPPLTANPDWTDPGHDHAPDRLLLGSASGFRLDRSFPALRGWTSGVAFTDLDRDGDDDLVVARYAELAQPREPAGTTTLLRNDGGRFTVVPGLPPGPGGRLGGRSVAVLDHDGDGWLDLLLVQDRYGGGSSRLLRNPGRLGRPWTDVTAAAGLPLDLEGFSASTADLDGDGRGDIFVAGSDRVLLRRGARYVESRRGVPAGPPPLNTSGGTANDVSTGTSAGDVDGDGRTDLLLAAHWISVETHDHRVPPVRLLLNRGNDASGAPVFRDVTAEAGLPLQVRSKSASAHLLDVDHDGRLDVVASVANGTTVAAARPTVFRATGRRSAGGVPLFASPRDVAGVRGPRTPNAAFSWVALPWADVDRDGRLDVAADHFFTWQGVRLFRGAGDVGHWLAVALDSRSATEVGAHVAVYRAGGLGDRRQLLGTRTITATDGYASAVPTEARFGLGAVTRVDVRVTPPTGSRTGRVDLRGVAADRSLRVGGSGRC